jgi:membrane protein DedA with SNARE-associated domain
VIHEALGWLAAFAVRVMEWGGYGGLALLMAAESMLFPVPSEAVMPFAGYIVSTGGMTWVGAILASSLGSMAGSWLSYLMGRHGLLPLVERYGRYVLVQPHHIRSAERLFSRRGTVAVFLCRFIPGVRHVSSIPAGAARMPLTPFLAASVAGATIWNGFLLWVGWRFGRDERAIAALKSNLDVVGLVLLALLAAYVAWEVRHSRADHGRSPE